MEAKIYQTIFRVDYPLAYKILDKLGEYSELIVNKTTNEPFEDGKSNVDFLNHSLSCTTKTQDCPVTLNLNVKAFDGVIEFPDGLDINELSHVPIFALADELLEKLEQEHSSKYNRIGIRSYIIIEDKVIKFKDLRDKIWDKNNLLSNALLPHFNERKDIGFLFESESKNGYCSKLRLGPYQKEEKLKYFRKTGDIEEGLIIDLDIYQAKVELPKFKLSNFVVEAQKIYTDMIEHISNNYEELVK